MNCPSSVVGVTDHLKSTFALFQHFLPRFFDKAVEVYEEIEQKEGDAFNENVDPYRPPLTSKIKGVIHK